MPEPRATPLASGPPPLWPSNLPAPQAEGFTVLGPPRVEVAEVLKGVTRLAVKARTAPMTWQFTVNLTKAQFEIFEGWYRDVIENHDGEFYAAWIGGDRIVAFNTNYTLAPVGSGWKLSCSAVRTRIDHSVCEGFISAIFTAWYQADITHADRYEADRTAADRYEGDWDLSLIAANEC